MPLYIENVATGEIETVSAEVEAAWREGQRRENRLAAIQRKVLSRRSSRPLTEEEIARG